MGSHKTTTKIHVQNRLGSPSTTQNSPSPSLICHYHHFNLLFSKMSSFIPFAPNFPVAAAFWYAFGVTLAVTPAIKPFGCFYDPLRSLYPLQMPFGVIKQREGYKYTPFHVFRMLLGPFGSLASAYAGYLGMYHLKAYPELANMATNLLLPQGLLNAFGHVQMCNERLVAKNQLYKSPILYACFAFNVIYSAILLRWAQLVAKTGVPNASYMTAGACMHVGGMVLTNVIRYYYFAKNDFDYDKMDENFLQPTCPVTDKSEKAD
jgi:uncharacterized membrane protein (DUF485 family)